MTNKLVELSLYCNQLYESVERMRLSDVDAYIKTAAFKTWKQSQEIIQNTQVDIVKRLDNLVGQVNGLTKVLATRQP